MRIPSNISKEIHITGFPCSIDIYHAKKDPGFKSGSFGLPVVIGPYGPAVTEGTTY